MFQKTHVREETTQLPRLLPKDAKTLEATAACQRDLDTVQECLQRFRDKWFREDPPDRESARLAALDLARASIDLENSARELRRLSSPLQ